MEVSMACMGGLIASIRTCAVGLMHFAVNYVVMMYVRR